MGIGDVIYKYLPIKYFKTARNIYYKLNSLLYPPLNEKQFKMLLINKLGVEKGMVVYIHSSTDKLNIDFSAFRLLEILMEVVGEDGTILFPCWHYIGRAEDYLNKPNAIFNISRSATTMGLLPELARRHKKAVRSLHPTTSIVALGAKAHQLIDEHQFDIYPNGILSPLHKIMQYNSRIIGLGEKVVSLSFVHVIEDVMKEKFPVQTLYKSPLSGKVIDENKNEQLISTLVPHKNISSRDIVGFFNKHITKKACNSFSNKGVNYFTVNPSELFNQLKELAKEGHTIYKN